MVFSFVSLGLTLDQNLSVQQASIQCRPFLDKSISCMYIKFDKRQIWFYGPS